MLSKLSGVPRATITNWLEGRVTKPRHRRDLVAVAQALRLSDGETDALLAAGGHPPLETPRSASSTDVAALGAASATSPLPRRLTKLVGRAAEIAAIREALASGDSRIVSIVGPGGVGKTHLAVAAAEGLTTAAVGETVWVSLAGVTEPDQVASAIMRALELHESNGSPARASLARSLRGERLLLVIDNFEHLLGAREQLRELVERTLYLKILVTTRVALRIGGEREFRIEPLPFPDPDALPAFDELVKFAAIELFVARSERLGGFALTPHNARTVAAICARLDGLPLALELAAARSSLLRPEDLLRRLDDRLSLLASADAEAAERQRTLRDTIAWSYALLDPAEQRLLRALAVFSGSASFEGIAATLGLDAGADLAGSNDLLAKLGRLVDHSLLVPVRAEGERPRFQLLETIREFAYDALVRAGEVAETRSSHARYFSQFMVASEAAYHVEASLDWLPGVEIEYANLRAALAHLCDDGRRSQPAAVLVGALCRYWFERGLFGEARAWLERLLEAEGIEAATHAKLLVFRATVANYEVDVETAENVSTRAIRALERLDDHRNLVYGYVAAGVAAKLGGRYDAADGAFRASLAIADDLDDQRGIAISLINLGEVAVMSRGDFRLADAHVTRALSILRRLGRTRHVAMALSSLAEMKASQHDLEGAQTLAVEALEIYRIVNNGPLLALESVRLARIALAETSYDRARARLTVALSVLARSFHAGFVALAFETTATLVASCGDADRSARLFGSARRLRDEFNSHRFVDYEGPFEPFETVERRIRLALGTEAFERAYELGRALDHGRAFDEANAALAAVTEASTG